ncbi:MAG TPA: malonyl-ACP O-methyltransferase BioC [Steroidobacteraceae bacterium]|nr:malonyl-ACP O-methyltransferase BioC [Steroidobacteraceae bacterium]
MTHEFDLDRAEVRDSFSRAARSYDAAAVLQSRVRGELIERLDLVRLDPQVVLDLGSGTGHAASALKRRYRRAHVLALDLSEAMLREAGRQRGLFTRFDRVGADAAALPIRSGSVDLLYSNLMLQWCMDPDQVFRECRRILKPGGLLTFATLGPDTLIELRRAWQAADPAHVHVNRFLDMHDLGDGLIRAGLAEPVLDVERCTLTYEDVRDLMQDLKSIGAHNVASGRARGLTGRRTLAAMRAAYESYRRADGQLPTTYEVVFGHAWAPTGAGRDRREPPGVTRVPLTDISRRTPVKP